MKGVNNDAIGKLGVLLVDDDRFARESLRRLLSKLGFENITTAVDGKEALEFLGKNEIDLLLTDINMPHMGGLELLKSIRCGCNDVDRGLRTIIVTALTDVNILGLAISLDVNGFVNKPFKPLEVIQEMLKVFAEDNADLRDKSYYLDCSTDPKNPETATSASSENREKPAESEVELLSVFGLQPGMLLAEDVTGRSGDLLLSKGFLLTQRSINHLIELGEVVTQKKYHVNRPQTTNG